MKKNYINYIHIPYSVKSVSLTTTYFNHCKPHLPGMNEEIWKIPVMITNTPLILTNKWMHCMGIILLESLWLACYNREWDNLIGKPVTGMLQHRVGKWFKKESLLHLKLIYVHNNLKKFFMETYPSLLNHLTFPE